MTGKLQLALPIDRIAEFCRHNRIRELAVFGSVLRNDFDADSDVDVLVTFALDARYSVFDLVRMQNELSAILGRQVDFVDRRAIEQSDNYIRRRQILDSVEVVYGS